MRKLSMLLMVVALGAAAFSCQNQDFDEVEQVVLENDLTAATDNGFFAAGSITGRNENLRHAPESPEDRYGVGYLSCFVVKYQEDGQALLKINLKRITNLFRVQINNEWNRL